ncbi:MAG TPA: ABC transporter permease, partial [Aggregatilineales bacterium]|nr:ABC transporter permease [Aggregatilineales bacterium]
MELTLFDRRITIDFREILQRFGLLLVFFLLCAVLAVLSDRFLTISNLVNVLRQSAINGIIAIGMTYVILTGGIDLSVGSVLALSTVITASLLQSDVPVPLAFVAGLAVGGVLGLVNGVIITKLHIPPFITTLGMLVIARGLAL